MNSWAFPSQVSLQAAFPEASSVSLTYLSYIAEYLAPTFICQRAHAALRPTAPATTKTRRLSSTLSRYL